MDFDWTEEQRALRQAAIEFASKSLTEGAADRDRSGVFCRDAWHACAEFGLQGVAAPARWSGTEHDLISVVATLEGVGYGGRDNGLIFSVIAHAASCEGPLATFGTEEQKAEWIPRMVSGAAVGATAVTEADSGSHALGMRTTAVQDGGDWVLDGSKTFVTNAPVADLFVIYARTGGEGFSGLSCFLVPKQTKGLRIGPPIEKMGLRTSPMAEVFLESCRLPASAVLGAVGSGAMIFQQTMEVERLMVMAPAIGVMERLLERCVDHARERSPAGVPLAKYQAISHRIADIELGLESARLLLYRAAWHRLRRGSAARESALAKLAVSEAYVDCCRSAMQIFGGYGYVTDYEIERELRDALATTLYVGTSEIQRNLIAGFRGVG